MVDTHNKAGDYKLLRFEITNIIGGPIVQLKDLVYYFEIVESMKTGHIRGVAKIRDSFDLIHEMNLRGEEIFLIEYEDFFKKKYKHQMFVYSIDGITDTNDGQEVAKLYNLHFVSIDKFITESITVQKSYRDMRIHEMVQSLYEETYTGKENGGKELLTYDTRDLQWLVVPNYTPEQAMYFFARKAVPVQEQEIQVFRWFENRNRFYFTTHEALAYGIDTPIFDSEDNEASLLKFFYGSMNYQQYGNSQDGQILRMLEIIDIEWLEHVNTIRDMNEGGYRRKVDEIDWMNKRYIQTKYDYLDAYPDYGLPDQINQNGKDKPLHQREFVETYMSDYDTTLVLKDYTEIGVPSGGVSGSGQGGRGLSGTPTKVSADVNKREQSAVQYFIDSGYTPEQAAGIVGNLTHESAMNPNAVNPNDGGPGKDSIGIAQWNRERLDGLQSYANSRGLNAYDVNTQMGYVVYELNNNEASAGKALKNSTSASDAALAMTRYERFKGYEAGTGSSETRNRQADAERILQTYRENSTSDAIDPDIYDPRGRNQIPPVQSPEAPNQATASNGAGNAIAPSNASYSLRPNPYYTNSYNDKIASTYHHIQHIAKFTLYGRNNLTIGQIVELDIPKMDWNVLSSSATSRELDKEKSGKYLVESIRHVFDEGVYTMEVEASKSGFLKIGEDEGIGGFNKNKISGKLSPLIIGNHILGQNPADLAASSLRSAARSAANKISGSLSKYIPGVFK